MVGERFAQVRATDPDNLEQIAYAITTLSEIEIPFGISLQTGQLSLRDGFPLDFETLLV